MSYREKVFEAYDQSVAFVNRTSGGGPNLSFQQFRDYPDDAVLPYQRVAIPSYAVMVPHPNELADMLDEIGEESDYIEKAVAHESAHGKAAVAAGALILQYGVLIYQGEEDDEIVSVPFTYHDGPYTKLQLAACWAHPYDVSKNKGDMHCITSLGYSSIEEVGSKAIQNNSRRKPFAPIPLACI